MAKGVTSDTSVRRDGRVATFVGFPVVEAFSESDRVVLTHELLKPEPGSPWILGT